MKTFDEIFALATSPLHREYAETFTDHRLSWGVGVTQGVAVAMQEAKAEIDALKAERDGLLAENKRLQFQSDVIDALNDVAYCNGYRFGAQEMCAKYRKEADESIDRRHTVAKAAIAKARGESCNTF